VLFSDLNTVPQTGLVAQYSEAVLGENSTEFKIPSISSDEHQKQFSTAIGKF